MKTNLRWRCHYPVASVFSSLFLLFTLALVNAQPTILSTDPANFASGVSPSAAVVFTFSEPMDTANTSAQFISPATFTPLNTTPAWSVNNTVLTCTPNPPFPANTSVVWSVSGQNPSGTALGGSTGGFFMTGGGSGGGGISGTNQITLLSAVKFYFYQQTNSSPPNATNANYQFTAGVALSSNLVATAATVTLPGALSATTLNPNASGFSLIDSSFLDSSIGSQTAFEQKYPEGNYLFNVTAKPSNLQATVTLPATMAQPNAPYLTNYDAAQTVNVAQAFTLYWGALQNGTSSDLIALTLSSGSGDVYSNSFKGTVTSDTIPSGTFTANSTYSGTLVFYRFTGVTNSTDATFAARASGTLFSFNTVGTVSVPPGVSNPVWSANGLAFDVATSPNQVLNVLFSTNCALPIAQWQKIQTTNSLGTSVHITVPAQAKGGVAGFVRLQNGP